MPDIHNPMPEGLPLRDVIDFAAMNSVASLPLPDTVDHPYDTTITPTDAVEIPRYEDSVENVVDLRLLPHHQRDNWRAIPAGTILRGTVQLQVPTIESAVRAVAGTNQAIPFTDPDGRVRYFSQYITSVPLELPTGLHPLDYRSRFDERYFQAVASAIGLRRLIVDIRMPGNEDYGIVESVYALQRLYNGTPNLGRPELPQIVEGTVVELDDEPVHRFDAPERQIVLDTEQGPEVIVLSDRTRYTGASHALFFQQPNPPGPLVGDHIQIQTYPHDNNRLRDRVDDSTNSVDIDKGNLPILHLLETTVNSERWNLSDKAKAAFEEQVGLVREKEDPELYRAAYGKLLLRHIDADGNFTFSNQEVEVVNSLARPELSIEDQPLGARFKARTGSTLFEVYGQNVFSMTAAEYVAFTDKVISGEIRPQTEAHIVPFLLGAREINNTMADPASGPIADQVSERALAVALPRILQEHPDGMAPDSDWALLNGAIVRTRSFADKLQGANLLLATGQLVHNSSTVVAAQRLGSSVAHSISTMIDNTFDTKPRKAPLDRGGKPPLAIEDIQRVRNPQLLAIFQDIFPVLLQKARDAYRISGIEPGEHITDLEKIQHTLDVLNAYQRSRWS